MSTMTRTFVRAPRHRRNRSEGADDDTVGRPFG